MVEGRGTEGRGMKQRLKDRRGPREIKKKMRETDGGRSASLRKDTVRVVYK